MKKRFKGYLAKLIITVIASTSLFASGVYGAEQKPALKVEDAVKSALGFSNKRAINSNELEALKEQLKLNNNATYYQYQSIYLQKAKNEQQEKMIEDQIANDVTNRYNDILVLQKEIELINKNIWIGTKELFQMDIKNEKGLVNPITFQSKQVEVSNLKVSKTAKEDELKNDEAYFRIITGKDIKDYSLDDNISYEPFRIKGVADAYINSKVDLYLQYDKEIAKLNEDNIIQDGAPAQTYASYVKSKSAAETVTLNLAESQKNLKQTLLTSYSTMLNLEQQITDMQANFKVLDKKLQSAQLRYNAGLISVIEYDKQAAERQKAEVDMLKLVKKYNSLKETIQKPWISVL